MPNQIYLVLQGTVHIFLLQYISTSNIFPLFITTKATSNIMAFRQTQWQHPPRQRRPHHPHRLWLHAVLIASQPGLRVVTLQADAGAGRGHGRRELGHVRLLQDPAAEGPPGS